MNADDYIPTDFGVLKVGTWDENGMPTGWHIDVPRIGEEMPRWLLNEPVLRLGEGPACCVYLRGCYSDAMTRDRKAALLKAGGIEALRRAVGGAAGWRCWA